MPAQRSASCFSSRRAAASCAERTPCRPMAAWQALSRLRPRAPGAGPPAVIWPQVPASPARRNRGVAMPLGVALVVLSAGVLAAPAGTQSLERAEALVTRGRELSHNYGHHAARQLIKAYQAQSIAAAAAQKLNPQSDTSQLLTKIAAGIGVGLFMNAYSRFEESEADRYGAHMLYNAGYNPTGMTSFLLKMYRQQPRQPIKFLSTHPPLPDRVDQLAEYLEAFPLDQELAVDSETFQKIVVARFGNSTSAAPSAGLALLPPMPTASSPSSAPPAPAAPAPAAAPPPPVAPSS